MTNDPGIISSLWIEINFNKRKNKSEYSKKEIKRIKGYIKRKERLGFYDKRYLKVRNMVKRMGIK